MGVDWDESFRTLCERLSSLISAMKLRLPHTLFRAVLACFAPVVGLTLASVASAAVLHSSPTIQEYTDIAEGRGIYRFAYGASLIAYQNGEATYSLTHTPTFTSTSDSGAFTLVNNGSFQITVAHNGVMSNETFSSRYVGQYAQKYSGVAINNVPNFSNGINPGVGNADNPNIPTGTDYSVERISRLVTDATSAALCTDTYKMDRIHPYYGTTLIYHVGGGVSAVENKQGTVTELTSDYYGLTAGITPVTDNRSSMDVYSYTIKFDGTEDCSSDNPLPFVSLEGDSGSPVYIYNDTTGQFEIVGVIQGVTPGGNRGEDSVTQYNAAATTNTIDYMKVDVAANGETIYLSGATQANAGATITDGGYSTVLYQGTITQGGTETRYNGIALDVFSGGTWNTMSEERYNSNTWYIYTDSELRNAAVGTADLFYTNSLRFVAQTDRQAIELTDAVDLGVGYMQFSLADGQTSATFDLGAASADKFLSTAGFMVDKGVTLNNHLTYGAGRELRRVGEGTMNMVGSGNNNVLLNIGGGGLTHLARENGYAAYNVFVGTGATLSLADIGQVKHNVTLGAGGGTLDLHGNNYSWTATEGNADGHFSLTVYEGVNRVENAAIANLNGGTLSTLTIAREGDFEFAGAFRDGSTYTQGSGIVGDSRYTMMPDVLMDSYTQYTADALHRSDSALKVVYAGTGTMTMTGVYTLLAGSNAQGSSGMELSSGKVVLQGTNTIHATGSQDGTNPNRLQVANDWHYAMAEMNVQVGAGAAFELGHHALLLGDVSVASGGHYTMKQAVNERYEFVEGWYTAEDTYKLADSYGHKGKVTLADGASMAIRFDEGVATTLSYGGNISGAGSLVVDAGKGTVVLRGNNAAFSGTRTVESGSLHLSAAAVGDTSANKWLVKEAGSLSLADMTTAADVVAAVDAASTGVLALTKDMSEAISHGGLIIGAAEGLTVHYGSANASLAAADNQWVLGGGGGTLVVDFLLEGANTLVLGNRHGSGTVELTNTLNSFSGGIDIVGNVALRYADISALGSGSITLGYGNSVQDADGSLMGSGRVDAASSGILVLTEQQAAAGMDLSGHASLALGANGAVALSGPLTVGQDAAYRFGGSGTLTVNTELSGARGLVVDGQGTKGSAVVLARATAATGAVVVQGNKAGWSSEGDVRLTLAAENALAAASSLTVQNHGMVDLGGKSQQFNNLTGDSTAGIVDAIGGNTLTLHNTADSVYAGTLDAANTQLVKSGAGKVTLSGANLVGNITVNEGTLAYNASATNALGAVSGNGTFELTGGSVTSSNILVKSLKLSQSLLAYNNTLDGRNIEVSGQGAELRMGHWCNLNNSTLILSDGGQLSMSSSGFNDNAVEVKGSGILAVGETASADGNALFNVESTVSGNGTLQVTNYSGRNDIVYATHFKKLISDGANGGKLALSTNQGNLHIHAQNTYTGGTTIQGGTLTTHHADALGSGAITLTGGTLAAETSLNVKSLMSFTGSGEMKVTGALTLSSPENNSFSYSGTGAAVVEAAITNSASRMGINVASAQKGDDFVELTLSGAIGTSGTNFGINKNGGGTLKLSGTNQFAWGFNLNLGRVIAASDSALGTGSIDVASAATLEIAAGTHVALTHRVFFADNSELCLHSLDKNVAALTTTGEGIGQYDAKSGFGTLTLTLAEDINLTEGLGYKVLSLGSNVRDGVKASGVSVNYLGDGRFTFTTSFEDNTLYLGATQDANTTLEWNGTADKGIWSQAAQNTNWNRTDATQASFMNQDSVTFSDAATNKHVAVAAEGVKVASMTVSASGYQFSGGAVQAQSAEFQEEVALAQGGSLKLGDVFTVSQKDSGSTGTIGKVDMGSGTESGSAYIHGTGDGLTMLDNVVVDIAKGATLELKNVLLMENSRLTDDPATVAVENVTVAVGKANATMQAATTLPSGTSLVQTGGGASVTLGAETTVHTIFCSALDTVTVTGTSLTLDLSGYVSELMKVWEEGDYVSISFGETAGSLAHFDVTSLDIVATYDGVTFNEVYVQNGNLTSAATLYMAARVIPEPATATLSLLALSLLAARRRRK